MQPTNEQQSVIDASEDIIKVSAFAGTGKTSTLYMRAHAYPNRRMLYLTFTRAMREEAQERFADAPHVRVMGVHSLAYRNYAVSPQGPITRGWKVGNLYAPNLVQNGLANGNDRREAFRLAYAAIDVLNAFCNSIYQSPMELPLHRVRSIALRSMQNPQEALRLADIIFSSWKEGLPTNSFDTITHDGYLKLFQLTNPDLGHEVDELLFDEAQDASPVMAVLVRDASCRRIFVGDPHQAIYGFRYALNALERFAGAEYYLTESFRFGHPVAVVATAFLQRWKDEPRRMRGIQDPECEAFAFRPKRRTAYQGMAYLARTNIQLFERAVNAVDLGRDIYFVGGFENYRFEQAEEAWRFRNGEYVPKPPFSLFKDYDEMIAAAEAARDMDILVLHRIVQNYGKHIPEIIRAIRQRTTNEPNERTVILSTAHRAKGLEFSQVALEEGFMDFDMAIEILAHTLCELGISPKEAENMEPDELFAQLLQASFLADEDLKQEINLIYVACTRARKKLYIPEKIADLVRKSVDEIISAVIQRATLIQMQQQT